MNDQERQIISDIFTRLEQTAGQARDQEAERFIADKVKAQPYAPYAMAQSLYVQEEAMKSLNQQLEQLKAEHAQLQQQGGQSGGFLSSIFGGGQRTQPASAGFARPSQQYAPQQPQGGPWGSSAQAYAPQQGGPWGGQQGYPAQGAPAGGGFLKGALTTAAGVAGGMVVGNALMNAFSGGGHHALGNFSQSDMASLGAPLGGDGTSSGFDQGTYDQAGFDQGGFNQGGVSSDGFDQGGSGGGFQDASFDSGSDGGGFSDDDSSWT